MKILPVLFGSTGNSERSTFNRNLSAFAVCLLISALCWVLIVLSKEYQEKTSFGIIYTNLPKDKALINRLPDSIQLEISTSGFSMFRERVLSRTQKLSIDCSRLKTGNDNIAYLSTASVSGSLAAQLGSDYSVTHVSPDTLFFNFGAKISKLVPVKLNILLGFAKQFQLSDSIKIIPEKVMIYGSSDAINKIDHLNTDYVVLNDLDRTVVKTLGFTENGRGLGFSSDSVKVTIPVDRFTEGKMDVPVEVINLPAGIELKLFPDKVSVRYLVGINDLGKVVPSMFRVVIDHSKISEVQGSKLKAEIIRSPDFIHSASLDPGKIEFIIRKK